MENQNAKVIFQEYKYLTEVLVNTFNVARTRNPYEAYPVLARQIWRAGVLAEAWGLITQRVSGENVLHAWEEGR